MADRAGHDTRLRGGLRLAARRFRRHGQRPDLPAEAGALRHYVAAQRLTFVAPNP